VAAPGLDQPALMPTHTYRVGDAIGRDPDPRRAFLLAFGLGLKLQRVKRGLSQEEFADLIGMHRTFYGQLERAQRGTNISELPHIARALDVTVRSLLPESD
jgi:DNA-binding XRE family transcriptional regulator